MKIACFVELYNFDDKSERGALNTFKSTAESMGHTFEFIYKNDIPRIPDFDALFIRATTDLGNVAYIASRLADSRI